LNEFIGFLIKLFANEIKDVSFTLFLYGRRRDLFKEFFAFGIKFLQSLGIKAFKVAFTKADLIKYFDGFFRRKTPIRSIFFHNCVEIKFYL
jgi:hypothetical protein